MIQFKRVVDLQNYLQKLKTNTSIGFVPTMGALHAGHLSLLKKSIELTGKTVCSIFVNPTQFNNKEDFEKYPVNIEKDINLLEEAGCDILFLPAVTEIYPRGAVPQEFFDLGYLENILEGSFRPGHFRGVCMVVKFFLQIIDPAFLFVGQKDYQQCLVLQRLLYLINSPAQLVICATQRASDGLALSSRNLRLNEEERALAPEIYRTLLVIKETIRPGDVKQLKQSATDQLAEKGFKVDYIEIANAGNLQVIDYWDGNEPLVILGAAYLNGIRLIDNLRYESNGKELKIGLTAT